MNKPKIRAAMRAKNLALSPEERHTLSEQIFRRVESLPEFRDARTIAFFESLPDEPDTSAAIARWTVAGKRIVLPRITDWDSCTMTFDADPSEIDLFLVPGVAFTPDGHRLGRGKGFYDRYLSLCPDTPKIGICYPHQMVEKLPAEEHDVLMTKIPAR